MTAQQVAEAQQAINTVLRRHSKPPHQERLRAIQLALCGKLAEAATAACVQPRTVRRWLLSIHRLGIAAYLRQFEPVSRTRRLDTNPATLRALARNVKCPLIRRRFVALACLAEGFSIADAARHTGLRDDTVRNNLRRFQQGGIAAIRTRFGPGASSKD